ncbi:MAG: hypothetical protein ACP5F9_02940 [Thiomonas sp.]
MSALATTLRTAWLAMLMLLLGLMPFIHGHLGQPVQNGWHIHALSSVGELRASPQFAGLACVGSDHRHPVQPGAQRAQAPEPSDVELVPGIVPTRLPQIRPAQPGDTRDVQPALAWRVAALLPPAEPPLKPRHGQPHDAQARLPRLHHGLPPPAQAPPLPAFLA